MDTMHRIYPMNPHPDHVTDAVTRACQERANLLDRALTDEEHGCIRAGFTAGLICRDNRVLNLATRQHPHGHASYEGASEDVPDGESTDAGEDTAVTVSPIRLPVAGVIGGPADENDRAPNYWQGGVRYLFYCFVCDRKNASVAVRSGRCAWCGWPDFPEPGKAAA